MKKILSIINDVLKEFNDILPSIHKNAKYKPRLDEVKPKLVEIKKEIETMNPDEITVKTDTSTKLELQLHEQYAVNNNANLSSAIAIFVPLIAVIGVYFNVFLATRLDCVEYDTNTSIYSDEDLIIISIVASFVLFIITYICIKIGFKQRKEQFIVWAIRHKYYFENKKKNQNYFTEIFPKYYTPFEKEVSKYIQGLYGELLPIISFFIFLIWILTTYKLYERYNWGCLLFLVIMFMELMVIHCLINQHYSKYIELEGEYYNKYEYAVDEKDKQFWDNVYNHLNKFSSIENLKNKELKKVDA